MLAGLRNKFPNIEIPESYAKTDDNLDALVAAITTREAAQGTTIPRTNSQPLTGRQEGWTGRIGMLHGKRPKVRRYPNRRSLVY